MEKLTFGQFLAQCRNKKGLTQKELADKLFVGESAVSKWEADKRRPDLELVTKLSEIFGITESELIKASIDLLRVKEKKQARNFRIINNTYNLILFIGFGIAVLACFIVNLAVSHTLSWFFIVLTALGLAGAILILPQYIKKQKLLVIPLSILGALYLLLGVCCIYTKGNWFFIPVFALLFAWSIIFAPLLVKVYLPQIFKKHNAVFSITVNAILLFILFIVIDLYNWSGWSFTKGLPILLFWLVPIYGIAGLLRYAKINWAFKTSVIISIFLVWCNISRIKTANGQFYEADLARWSNETLINANIMLLCNIGLLAFVAAFGIIGGIFAYKLSCKQSKLK